MKSISEQLRELRLKTGLSLEQVARKADTSPATLSRYEHGWKRFEVYTLNKVASALGYRVRIEFDKLQVHAEPVDAAALVRQVERLFWDTQLKVEHLSAYPDWVVERILEYGTLEDVDSVIRFLGRDKFLGLVAGIRFKSAKTGTFWRSILKKENIRCIQKSSRQEAASSWHL